jgi:CMP-N-acetylneuraminic acid synthetase
MVKVTLYICAYNYGRFLKKAIESVLKQTINDWELIIINDGSTDHTGEILSQYSNNPKIRIIEQENKGLNVSNNIALRLANGAYIMRLDADDYLDENILIVLSNILDTHPDVGLVYPDYYEVDEEGKIIHQVRRKKIGDEVEILDLPAHGACTLFRKEVLMQLGGYSEVFSCQDGYELWLRFIQKFEPYNVNIPLFYYRQHPKSITKKQKKLLETRMAIKRGFVEESHDNKIPKVLGVIPVTRNSVYSQNEPFVELSGKPLLWYTLNSISSSKLLDKVVLSSEDDEVLSYAKKFSNIEVIKRSHEFEKSTMKMVDLLIDILNKMEMNSGYKPEAVCTLYISTPLRQGHHIDKAIDTMTIFDVESVISVEEELKHCYHHGKHGLVPINISENGMRIERQSIYKSNSAIFLSKTETIKGGNLLGKKIGHIIMLPEESVKINSKYDLWTAEKILNEWHNS